MFGLLARRAMLHWRLLCVVVCAAGLFMSGGHCDEDSDIVSDPNEEDCIIRDVVGSGVHQTTPVRGSGGGLVLWL